MGNCQNAPKEDSPQSSSRSVQIAAPPKPKRNIRESMLDTDGNEMRARAGKNSKTKSGQGEARLANIFMSPVKIEENYVYPIFEKTAADKEFIIAAVSDNFIFADVEKEERDHLLNAFEEYSATKGTYIITEGEVGDYFYVIQEGTVEYVAQGDRVGVGTKGQSFGEIALLYDCPRRVSVVAGTDCSLWRVDQKSFRQILANGRLDGDRETIETLRKVSFLAELSEEYLAKMASAAKTQTFNKGDTIIKKGDPGNTFYILKDGTVAVKDIEAGGQSFADQEYKAGDFFGERAIVTEEPRAANISATSDCTTLCLSREDFLNIVGPLEMLMKKTNDFRILVSLLLVSYIFIIEEL
jgi:cAMP-dependent protein kinase regulator